MSAVVELYSSYILAGIIIYEPPPSDTRQLLEDARAGRMQLLMNARSSSWFQDAIRPPTFNAYSEWAFLPVQYLSSAAQTFEHLERGNAFTLVSGDDILNIRTLSYCHYRRMAASLPATPMRLLFRRDGNGSRALVDRFNSAIYPNLLSITGIIKKYANKMSQIHDAACPLQPRQNRPISKQVR